MRGHARVPEPFENVELAGRTARPQHARGKADFVVVGRVGQAHRLLVERREADGIRISSRDQHECMPIVGEGKRTAGA